MARRCQAQATRTTPAGPRTTAASCWTRSSGGANAARRGGPGGWGGGRARTWAGEAGGRAGARMQQAGEGQGDVPVQTRELGLLSRGSGRGKLVEQREQGGHLMGGQ